MPQRLGRVNSCFSAFMPTRMRPGQSTTSMSRIAPDQSMPMDSALLIILERAARVAALKKGSKLNNASMAIISS